MGERVTTLKEVFTRRLVQFINVLIGCALTLAGIGTYWYAYRPLPQTSGSVAAPVKESVRVERDALAMPRIHAASLEDLMFAQGFVTAQDRFWQMETFRKMAMGELAGIVGPQALESDREFRRLRLSRIAERQAKTVAGEDRSVLAAYARGVNHYLETHANKLPLEFSLIGHKPRPWRIEDSLLVGLMMQQTLSARYKLDLAREAMYEKGDAKKIDAIWPARSGQEEHPGSNAWAVGGSRTKSGKAALANDMHLQWSVPGIWHMVHLKGGGLNVAGVTVPGSPGVVVGRNEQIAWGITNMPFDVQDLYWFVPTAQQTAVLEREVISVRGARAEPFQQLVAAGSPILPGPAGKPVRLRWSAAEDRPFQLGLIKLNRATEWNSFRDALREFPGAASQIAYADAQGNIGLQAVGVLPVRKGCDGGRVYAAGACDWQGFIPFDELPSIYNPSSGRAVTANQNSFPAVYPYQVAGHFASPYRANRIAAMLEAKKDWDAEAMLKLQGDVYSAFSHFIAKELVAALDRKKATNPVLRDAVDQLRQWDGAMAASRPEPLIVTLAVNQLRRSIGVKAAGFATAEWDSALAFSVIENMVRTKPPEWFADWDHELLRCLQEGIDDGARRQGRDTRKWQWGEHQKLTLANRVTAQIPWIGPSLQLKPHPLEGSTSTIMQTSARIGPSMRMVIDFGDPRGGLLNIPIGQSGHALASHNKDQWEAFLRVESFPLHFNGGWTVESTLTLTPVK
ncbi:MAG: penicillin acylase family protein [Acidobacteria bacterium]|nr:penicillin acylase family protein [Acidobacteriota bacterium]